MTLLEVVAAVLVVGESALVLWVVRAFGMVEAPKPRLTARARRGDASYRKAA